MPRQRARRTLAAVLCLTTVPLSSCFVRRRVVAPQGKREAARPILTATKEELIQRIEAVSNPIQSFTITADLSPSVGGLYGGEVTDYATIRGYILFRKPDDIRIIGLDPVIHTKAFDMVSVGPEFHLYIPVKNRFLEGRNDVPATSANKLENLRPAAFLNSLLISPPDPKTDASLLEDDTNESKAVYILLVIERDQDQLRLLRNVYFDRHTLQITRQKSFNAVGGIVSDTLYSDWKVYSGIPFPSSIDIKRPQDGYEVSLTVVDMKMNNTADVTPDKFILNQPPGSQLQQLK